MLFAQLKQHINDAIATERRTRQFAQEMSCLTSGLHATVNLPEKKPGQSLAEFVEKYVAQVPKSLAVMEKAAAEAETRPLILPLIKITEDFFFKPPAILSQSNKFKGVMEAAYLSHRLIEEINDRYMAQAETPLLPVDMLTANLIIHNLIGEPFANQLDDFCFKLAQVLINPDHSPSQAAGAAVSKEKQILWTKAWQHWSETLDETEVSIELPRKGREKKDNNQAP